MRRQATFVYSVEVPRQNIPAGLIRELERLGNTTISDDPNYLCLVIPVKQIDIKYGEWQLHNLLRNMINRPSSKVTIKVREFGNGQS